MWLKQDNELKKIREYNFSRELKTLLNSITIHCYRYFVEKDRGLLEFLMWFCINIFGAISLIYICLNAWGSFTMNPLVTTLHDTLYHVRHVPFPAIAVCNSNRISKREAEKYAFELTTKDPFNRTTSYFLERIRYLGRILDYEIEDQHIFSEFQEFLDKYDSNNLKHAYDTYTRMKSITPNCSNLLIKCFWKSIEFPCILKEYMMEMRRAFYGHCCAFNYVRADFINQIERDPYFSDVTGPDMGLIILIQSDTSDYFYPMFNQVGYKIVVHNPVDFPDSPSGSVSERFIQLGYETFVRIDAVTVRSVPDVFSYSIEKRECLFRTELPDRFASRYKRSDCIVNCRVRSIYALCACVPYYLPVTNFKSDGSVRICTLQDVPCLNKYKVKWFTVVTKITQIPGLEREMEESLYCPECLPECSDIKYRVTTTSLPLFESKRKGFGVTNGVSNISDVSVIRIFFGQPDTWLYKQDVALYWFEIFCNFGGMCGIICGFSLISGSEIIYFILKQIILVLLKYSHINTNTHVDIYP